jgi:hypothetical protein
MPSPFREVQRTVGDDGAAFTRTTPLERWRFGAEGVLAMERSERFVLAATLVVAASLSAVILMGLHRTAGAYLVHLGAVMH